jgi:nucleoside-diphosphate-sugar epimerase
MYGSSPRPQRECDFRPGAPIPAPYTGGALTKLYVEQMCEFYASLGRTRFTVVRHANVYGPHDKFDLAHSHVFGASMTKVLEGDGPIVVWGNGTEARDLLFVQDLVEFVERALDRQRTAFELLNAGTGSLVTVSSLVHQLRTAAGVTREVMYDSGAPTIATSVCLDSEKARRVLGWEPRTSLAEGMARTLAWRRAAIAAGNRADVHV